MKLYNAVGDKTFTNNNIPKCSGVYFLWSEKELIYIGKAKNLRIRIAQHSGNGFMKIHMVNPEELEKVSVIKCEDEFDATRLEKQFLELIFPKYNQKPWYEYEDYRDWKFGEGKYAIKDKHFENNSKENNPTIDEKSSLLL